jgi:hypothetical protein
MKQFITASQWNELPFKGKIYTNHWKIQKGYRNHYLELGQCLELAAEISHRLYKDEILHGTFNYVLDMEEYFLAYDGDEPIEIMWFKIVETIKKRLAKGLI